MNAVIKSFRMLINQIKQDGVLLMVLIAPLLSGLFFKLAIPVIESRLIETLDYDVLLTPYYQLFDLILMSLTSYLLCFISAMTMLDEYDSNIINHLIVTPIRKSGYLVSRLGIPLLIAFIVSVIMNTIFSLQSWSSLVVVIICALMSLMSLSIALIIFSFSKNKVEGLILAKLAGLMMGGLLIPYFIEDNTQYLFSFLPSFWIAKLAIKFDPIYLFLSLITAGIWLCLLYRKFEQKLSK